MLEIADFLGAKPSNFGRVIKRLTAGTNPYVTRLYTKHQCKQSDRPHFLYRFSRDLPSQTVRPKQEEIIEPTTGSKDIDRQLRSISETLKVCACGCGRSIIITPRHKRAGRIPDFIHGHNLKGKKYKQARRLVSPKGLVKSRRNSLAIIIKEQQTKIKVLKELLREAYVGEV